MLDTLSNTAALERIELGAERGDSIQPRLGLVAIHAFASTFAAMIMRWASDVP
jgi:hypothetical protein